jgi:hypothetical protein
MKTFYFDGILPEGYKAIKQDDCEIEKSKYIIINTSGLITSSITCDSEGYVEIIENFKNNLLFHKRVFSDQAEYEEEYENHRLVKKSYSTNGYDFVEKYKGGYVGSENEPAIIKSNLDGLIIVEEWYEKTEITPNYGFKHRKNIIENGKLKSQPARILKNIPQNKITKFYYQNDDLNDGVDGAPAIQEFDLETNMLMRSVRMKNNTLYKGEKASIEGTTKENNKYEIYDKDNLKTCEIKVIDQNITKKFQIKDGKVSNSEIAIDFTSNDDKEIISYITKLLDDNPQKIIEIFKSLTFDSINNKYNSTNIHEENNESQTEEAEKRQFKKKLTRKKVDKGEEYGAI